MWRSSKKNSRINFRFDWIILFLEIKVLEVGGKYSKFLTRGITNVSGITGNKELE
jgi:hypothetical protein